MPIVDMEAEAPQTSLSLLREESWWKLFHDKKDHGLGSEGYSEDQSPGHTESMMAAYKEALANPKYPSVIDAEIYQEMHRLATEKTTVMDGLRGIFSGHNRCFGGHGVSGQALKELLERKIGERKLLVETANPQTLNKENDGGVICALLTEQRLIYTNHRVPDVPKIINDIFSEHYKSIENAQDDLSKVRIISRTVRDLHVGHFFKDGNGRLNMFLLMNALLINEGLVPAILPEGPEVFGGLKTVNDLEIDIIDGMLGFLQECKGKPSALLKEYTNRIDELKKESSKFAEEQGLQGNLLLIEAVKRGNNTIVARLLKEGVLPDGVDTEEKTAICYALKKCRLETLNLLLADKVSSNRNYLCAAIRKGELEIAKLLIAKGVDINTTVSDDINIYGCTPVSVAAINGDVGAIRMLYDLGADISTPSKYGGRTPVYMAAESGHADAVRALCDLGANVNTHSLYGYTPAWVAAASGHADVIKALFDLNADIDTPIRHGSTPLSAAAEYGHADVIKALVELGADVNIPNADGFTPASIAEQNGHADAIIALGANDKAGGAILDEETVAPSTLLTTPKKTNETSQGDDSPSKRCKYG